VRNFDVNIIDKIRTLNQRSFMSNLWICPECAHEWTFDFSISTDGTPPAEGFFDANGVELHSTDTVTTIKDLKVGSETIKSESKVKGIKLLEETVNGHDISCCFYGFGS